ncbi:hypothetical protein EXW60_15500 [Bacillus mycoides]|nr:hypothetical protein EXW60_15500 [Bacillus mycoides]QWG88507.1 hypothetical protein EXW40_04800 [Bacillus mycoides]
MVRVTINLFILFKIEHASEYGYAHTSINLRYLFIQNVVFSRSLLLSFIDSIKVGTSNKP